MWKCFTTIIVYNDDSLHRENRYNFSTLIILKLMFRWLCVVPAKASKRLRSFGIHPLQSSNETHCYNNMGWPRARFSLSAAEQPHGRRPRF